MADTTVNRSPKSADVGRLQVALEDIDALAQGGFGQIESIARLALAALQTPEGYLRPEAIVQALIAIRDKAAEVENCINWAAEEVGCNYRDEKLAQRRQVRAAADQSTQMKPANGGADEPDLKLFH